MRHSFKFSFDIVDSCWKWDVCGIFERAISMSMPIKTLNNVTTSMIPNELEFDEVGLYCYSFRLFPI